MNKAEKTRIFLSIIKSYLNNFWYDMFQQINQEIFIKVKGILKALKTEVGDQEKGLRLCRKFSFFFFSMCLFSSFLFAEENSKKDKEQQTRCQNLQEEAIETFHEVIINDQPVSYKAIAGHLVLKNDKCDPTASIFYVSYTREGMKDSKQRPITFCFNGGPGSSSIWLHVGIFGPKRIDLTEHKEAVPPYQLIDNEYSILDLTDLVFIDPVSTGFSQAIPSEDAKKFHGVEEDIKSIAEFIRLYVTHYNRWDSPKFIAGESYGTTRAAGLADYLHDHDYMYINGLVFISTVLNFQSLDFGNNNDLSYLLYLPSFTAAAWYHKKLSPDLQEDFYRAIEESKNFVFNEYTLALFKGDLITQEEKENIIKKLARYTGLSQEYIEQSNMRITIWRFVKELLRHQRRTIGRFDSRFKGIDADATSDHFEYDPSANIIFGAFTATFNFYLRNNLKYSKDQHYKILSNVHPWDYGPATNQHFNMSEDLRAVMTKNSYLRVFVANGYFDLATPFFATEYTFNHLGLDSTLRQHVTMHHYEAGHMMYIHRPSLIKLKKDLSQFYLHTLQNQDSDERKNHFLLSEK
jgi:carboxypeptidase C (cathepsin A)